MSLRLFRGGCNIPFKGMRNVNQQDISGVLLCASDAFLDGVEGCVCDSFKVFF